MAVAFSWTGYVDTDLAFSEFFNGDHTITLRYMRAQTTTFCATFNSHVAPTHWSRRMASASSASSNAFFH